MNFSNNPHIDLPAEILLLIITLASTAALATNKVSRTCLVLKIVWKVFITGTEVADLSRILWILELEWFSSIRVCVLLFCVTIFLSRFLNYIICYYYLKRKLYHTLTNCLIIYCPSLSAKIKFFVQLWFMKKCWIKC